MQRLCVSLNLEQLYGKTAVPSATPLHGLAPELADHVHLRVLDDSHDQMVVLMDTSHAAHTQQTVTTGHNSPAKEPSKPAGEKPHDGEGGVKGEDGKDEHDKDEGEEPEPPEEAEPPEMEEKPEAPEPFEPPEVEFEAPEAPEKPESAEVEFEPSEKGEKGEVNTGDPFWETPENVERLIFDPMEQFSPHLGVWPPYDWEAHARVLGHGHKGDTHAAAHGTTEHGGTAHETGTAMHAPGLEPLRVEPNDKLFGPTEPAAHPGAQPWQDHIDLEDVMEGGALAAAALNARELELDERRRKVA